MDLLNLLEVSKIIEYDTSNPNKDCGMCMEPLSNTCRELKCGHIFHTKCIDLWLSQNTICPACRYVLSEEKINLDINKLKQQHKNSLKNLEATFFNKNLDLVKLQTGIEDKNIVLQAIKNNNGDIYQAIIDLTN